MVLSFGLELQIFRLLSFVISALAIVSADLDTYNGVYESGHLDVRLRWMKSRCEFNPVDEVERESERYVYIHGL